MLYHSKVGDTETETAERIRKRDKRDMVDVLGVFLHHGKQAKEVSHIQRDGAGESGGSVAERSDGKAMCCGDGSFSDFRVGSWAICGKVLMEEESF